MIDTRLVFSTRKLSNGNGGGMSNFKLGEWSTSWRPEENSPSSLSLHNRFELHINRFVIILAIDWYQTQNILVRISAARALKSTFLLKWPIRYFGQLWTLLFQPDLMLWNCKLHQRVGLFLLYRTHYISNGFHENRNGQLHPKWHHRAERPSKNGKNTHQHFTGCVSPLQRLPYTFFIGKVTQQHFALEGGGNATQKKNVLNSKWNLPRPTNVTVSLRWSSQHFSKN